MRKKHVTFGGLGQHEVKIYAPDKSSGTHKRRSRNRCANYRPMTHECAVLGIGCVGPSNSLCKDYHEQQEMGRTVKGIEVGRIVNHPRFGVGMIVEVSGGNGFSFYTVRFHRDDFVKKFTLREIKEILL